MDDRIWGVHAVREALQAATRPIERIHVTREIRHGRIGEIVALAKERGIPVRKAERAALDRLAEGGAHQGVVAEMAAFAYAPLEALSGKACSAVVILDGVEDPRNLGAVARTAEACGVSGIIVPERHAAPLNAAAAKASAGALAHLAVVRVRNVSAAIEELKSGGFWVVGLDPDAPVLWTEFDYTGRVALVIGGEHRGLRRLVREHCDAVVRLPMSGRVGSLNVSVAAAVVLYEMVRQRSAPAARPAALEEKPCEKKLKN